MAKTLTKREKDAIRALSCGKCGATPPFPDGSRCHPHRVVPALGYLAGNVVPRCPDCHAAEPGHPVLPKTAYAAGRKGGLHGAGRTHALHPDQASENARRAIAARSERQRRYGLSSLELMRMRFMGRRSAQTGAGTASLSQWRKQYPDEARAQAQEAGRKGALARWGVRERGDITG